MIGFPFCEGAFARRRPKVIHRRLDTRLLDHPEVWCPTCETWWHYAGILNHMHSHSPVWCECANPTIEMAYGWRYCGRCLRGFEPTLAP